jgi:hypothetical protein
LLCCSVALLLCCSVALLLCCSVALLLCCSVALLLCCSVGLRRLAAAELMSHAFFDQGGFREWFEEDELRRILDKDGTTAHARTHARAHAGTHAHTQAGRQTDTRTHARAHGGTRAIAHMSCARPRVSLHAGRAALTRASPCPPCARRARSLRRLCRPLRRPPA